MQIRKAVFLIAQVNIELVFKQDESIDIYFTSSKVADPVLSKSKEIILDGSKILTTTQDVEKLHKYVLYGVYQFTTYTSVKVEDIQNGTNRFFKPSHQSFNCIKAKFKQGRSPTPKPFNPHFLQS